MIIDSNINLTKRIPDLKKAGVASVGRYIAAGLVREEKVIKPLEAKAIADAGLRLFLIYERNGRPYGAEEGKRDGAFALEYAKTIGAPKGAAIYYTVDYDAGPGELTGIVNAFAAFKEALQGYYEVGAYASGFVCNHLHGRGFAKYRWLTMSMGFRGSREARANGEYELCQLINKKVGGIDVDPDVVHGANGEFGDFVPFVNVSADPKAEVKQSAAKEQTGPTAAGAPTQKPTFWGIVFGAILQILK